MSGVIRKCVWTLVMAGCGCGALALPAPALASTGNCKDLQFGPIRVNRGFQMTLLVAPSSATSGGGSGQQAALGVNIQKTDLPKGRNPYFADSEGFEYAGLGAGDGATCKMSRDGTGTLSGTWGRALNLKLQLRRGPRRGQVVARGRFDVDVHSAAFGTIRRSSVSGVELSEPTGPTRPPSPEIATFGAYFDNATLQASEYKNGLGCIDVHDTRRDAPANGVSGQMGMQVCGNTVFSAPSSLQSATFDGATPFTRGSLAFTCTGDRNGVPGDGDGTLSGTLTVADPALGPLSLAGSPQGLLRGPDGNHCIPETGTTSSSQATS